MNKITCTDRQQHTVMDCDTYGRLLRGGYGYRFKEAYEAYGRENCQFNQ